MAVVNKLMSYGLVAIILTAAGCASSATDKPEPGPASSVASKPAPPSPGEGQRSATGESTTRAIDEFGRAAEREAIRHLARSRRFTLALTATIWRARRAKHSK